MTIDRHCRLGALLGGAAIVGAALAVNPVTAGELDQVVHALKVKSCNSSNACTSANNAGSGPGVQGANSGSGVGAYASAASFDGLQGHTSNPSATQKGHSGVYGEDDSSDNAAGNSGVYGVSTNGSGAGGYTQTGWGVHGTSSSGAGVFGLSILGAGVAASSMDLPVQVGGQGVAGGKGPMTQAIGGTAGDGNGYSIIVYDTGDEWNFAVDNLGDAYVARLLYTGGFCKSGCDRTRGGVKMYVTQSSAPILADSGEAQLVGGKARVAFDSTFANAIDRTALYVVFLSPEGANQGLYVSDKTPTGFTIFENGGGRSTIPVGYRIMARPFGAHAQRFAVFAASHFPKPAHLHRPALRVPR